MNRRPDGSMTRVVNAGRDPTAWNGAVNPPIYRVSTVIQDSMADRRAAFVSRDSGDDRMVYGRTGTPTTLAIERAVAELEGGYRAQAYPSGLAAIVGSLTAFASSGDTILVSDSVYGPARRFCDTFLRQYGVKIIYFDPHIGADIEGLITRRTSVVYMESPGSLTFEVMDVRAVASAAKRAGATTILDNTWATPLLFRPLEHGVDVSIHAGTKYIVGHSDAMIGIAVATEEAWPRLRNVALQTGVCIGTEEAYLAHRGLRSLSVRLRQHHEGALAVSKWLSARDEVATVLYPPLPGSTGHDLWKRDFSGGSGLLAFELTPNCGWSADGLIDRLKLFGIGSSWGGYESLAIVVDPGKYRTATKWEGRGELVRLHVGLEDPADLIADLEEALEQGV